MVKDQQRLLGIDLFRGLAIYAVILLHIDEGVKVMPPLWSKITDFALFAVPFFLATSFYLATHKLYISQKKYPLRSRLVQLLVPYGVWSVFYILYKTAKYVVAGESEKLLNIFKDPLSCIFFGGTAFHLYFLPLLATGTFLISLVNLLISRKISIRILGIITFFSLLTYEVVLFSGNGLKTPENVAFESLLSAVFPGGNSNPFLRLMLVLFFWSLRCFPYVMIAMILSNPSVNQNFLGLINRYSWLWVLVFVGFNIIGALITPQGIYDVARGYTALFAAIAISSKIKHPTLIKSLGLCSFGIYLIHLLFVEIFQSAFVRLHPNYIYDVNTFVLLLSSGVVLVVSWGITSFLLKQKRISKFIFGF
jgi:peptidoglycan/LPS O-acetylase OafA/YrhL